MAYIYKKQVSGRTYYYLRTSKRVEGKVVAKDIAYLGSDPKAIEKKLDDLPKKYQKEIRKAHRNIKKFLTSEYLLEKVKAKKIKNSPYISRELLEKIEISKLHYQEYFLKEDELSKQEAYKQYLIDFAYNTTSLEGNTITLKEAERLLEEHLTPKDRTLREIYDLQNEERVFFALLKKKEKVSNKLIIWIHDQLLENIDKRIGYRTSDIRVFRARFKASPGKFVKADMNLLLDWYKQQKKKLHPFVLAAIFHQKLEKIHPFADGNGRTGRMLMNYMLMQAGYPPTNVQKKFRGDYLDTLQEGNAADLLTIETKHFKPIVEFLADETIANYWNKFL